MEGSASLSSTSLPPTPLKAKDEAWPQAGEVGEQKETSGPKPGPGSAPA